MNGQRTVGQYRAIDLALFSVMLLIFETLIIRAAVSWFPGEPYTVSVVPAIVAIIMVRWGPWAAIHAVLGGLVFCYGYHSAGRQYVIYCIGNLLSLCALPVLNKIGSDRVTGDSVAAVLYGLCVLLLMQLGRAIVSLFFGADVYAAAGFFTTDVISLLFTPLILWIVRRLDGVLEDQKHYLLRLKQEQEKEKGGF